MPMNNPKAYTDNLVDSFQAVKRHLTNMHAISTLQHLSAMKLAVVCCNDADFKNYICDSLKEFCQKRTNGYLSTAAWNVYFKFHHYSEIVKKTYQLPQCLQNEVINLMERIAKNMVEWCLYHTVKFDLVHSYGFHFLNESMLTSEGDVMYFKAAEKIVNDQTLSVGQRFKVACGYFMTDKITELWKTISTEEKESFFFNIKQQDSVVNHNSQHEHRELIHQSQLPRIWAHYLTGKLQEIPSWQGTNDLPIEEAVWKHAVKQSVADSDVRAVRLAWERHSMSSKESFAVEMVSKVCNQLLNDKYPSFKDTQLVDIFCFLMSNMSEVSSKFLREILRPFEYLQVLFHLLFHDTNDIVIQALTSMWDVLSLEEYVSCLGLVNISRDEGETFRRFWKASPEHYRKYALDSGHFISRKIIFDCLHVEIWCIINVLSVEERFQVVFSKFEASDFQSGLFLLAFVGGYLDLAKWLATSCNLKETELKELLSKELNYFANELKFEAVTNLELVLIDSYFFMEHKVDWVKESWTRLRNKLQTINMLEQYNDFFLWCFTSKEEMIDFKKKMFLSMCSSDIYYGMTFDSLRLHCGISELREFDDTQKDVARRFLDLFLVDENQLRDLNKQAIITFFNSDSMTRLLSEASKCQQSKDYRVMMTKVMAVLKWCLTDKELLLEVKDVFRDVMGSKYDVQEVIIVKRDFELVFEEHLHEPDAVACQCTIF